MEGSGTSAGGGGGREALLGIFIASGAVTVLGFLGTAFTVAATPSPGTQSHPSALSVGDFTEIGTLTKPQKGSAASLLEMSDIDPQSSYTQPNNTTVPPSGNTMGQFPVETMTEEHICGDIIRDFNNIADAYVKRIKDTNLASPFNHGPYDVLDRVGKIGLNALKQIEIDASSMISKYGHAATLDEFASKQKDEFAKNVRGMCDILRGTFEERLRAHVNRIEAKLVTYADVDGRYETTKSWLKTEADIYAYYLSERTRTHPRWDAMDGTEARLLHKLYTDTSTELYWAASERKTQNQFKREIDALVQQISEEYTRQRKQ